MDNKMMNKIARQVFSQQNTASQFQNTPTSNHTHNGIDSPRIPNLTLNSDGFVKGGQTDYNTGIGFFVGYSGGDYKLSLGNPNANNLTWDGTRLTINGDFVIGQLSITATPGDDLQADINYLIANGGGTLYLTAGTFDLSTYSLDLSAMTAPIRVIGVGSDGSVIDFGNTAHQLKAVSTVGNELVSPFFQGFTVQNSSVDLVHMKYVINFGCTDLTCRNGLTGLKLENVTTANVYSSLQDACGTGLVGKDSNFFTLFSSNSTGSTSGGGVSLNNVTNSTSIACSVDSCVGGGYIFDNCSDFGFEDWSITNITGVGVEFKGGSFAIGVLDGFTDTCSSDGMYIHDSSVSIQIATANTFSNNGGYGINVAAGSADISIVGNSFASNTSGAVNDLGTRTIINSNSGVSDKPQVTVLADAASITPSSLSTINTQANTQILGTLTANAPSGTPWNGQLLELVIKSTNVQTFSWNAIYTGCTTTALPTATTGGTKTDKFFFQYNSLSSKWEIYNAEYGY